MTWESDHLHSADSAGSCEPVRRWWRKEGCGQQKRGELPASDAPGAAGSCLPPAPSTSQLLSQPFPITPLSHYGLFYLPDLVLYPSACIYCNSPLSLHMAGWLAGWLSTSAWQYISESLCLSLCLYLNFTSFHNGTLSSCVSVSLYR